MKNPSVLQEDHPIVSMMSSNTDDDDDDDDEEARQQAVRYQYEASELVRNHLESHVVNNPGASSDYVTWIATLHPENSDVIIDQRFFIPGNPWWTIYEETKNNQIPTATAVPIGNEEEQQPRKNDDDSTAIPSSSSSSASASAPNTTGTTLLAAPKAMPFWKTCSPLSILCGMLLCVPALVAVLSCELMALILCHFPAVVFFRAARALSPPNCCTGIFDAVLRLLYEVFSFCDSIILLASVMVAEIVALVALVVGFITGGVMWARYLHQQIRRLCHGLRIVFRLKACCTTKKNPPRQFFFMNCCDDNGRKKRSSNENENGDDNINNDDNNNNGVDGYIDDDNNVTTFQPTISVMAPPMAPPSIPPPILPPSHDRYYSQQEKHNDEEE